MMDERPHVIWVFGDQHRAQATDYIGDPNLHTPNLDRFAAEGVTFTHAVSGYSYRGALNTTRTARTAH